MRRLAALTALTTTLALASAGVTSTVATAAGPVAGTLKAGAAVVDDTWHVGASAGQYASSADISAEWDPNAMSVKNAPSYGVASRMSVRSLVLQSGNDAPVAIVKQDLYLAQDLVVRRAAQILAADHSSVTYDNILVSATHDHNSPYYSTPAAGVWVFQDAFDLRFFEYHARAIAHSIELAESRLAPAKIGATTIEQPFVQSNIVGPSRADDGTPAGYPQDENDHGLVVMRVDNADTGKAIATWMNYGEHGESLDGYDLISADFLAPLERYIDRETGAPLIFSQGGVGSSEGPYDNRYPGNKPPTYPSGPSAGVKKAFAHIGYAQAERGARILADSVEQGRGDIVSGNGQVAMTSVAPVRMVTDWIPGPLSHPYPAYGNCRMQSTLNGDPGVGGAPDCERVNSYSPFPVPTSPLYDNLRAAGLPIPDTYAGTSFNAVEENMRIKLQAVRIGEIMLASCSCEAQVDIIKNLESRLDNVAGNIYDGYDYVDDHGDPAHNGCVQHADTTWTCKQANAGAGTGFNLFASLTDAQVKHMQAEIHNDAKGWDDPLNANNPANAVDANSEPTDPTKIWGNFTKTELPANKGYQLVVGLGHTGDYDGYTVSYREFQSRDSYRKALTSYGPHTADYMNTHLLDVARFLRDGTSIPPVPNQAQGDADEQREQAEATALGKLGATYLDTWDQSRSDDLGPAAVTVDPKPAMKRFDAAAVTWRGGSNWVDNPNVKVQRLVDGAWTDYADQSGEIITTVHKPTGVSLVAERQGTQEWLWTATFEAFDAWPKADVPGGQVPAGTYRFVVDGHIEKGGPAAYHLESKVFQVQPWDGLKAGDPSVADGGNVVVHTDPVVYPRTYTADASFPFVRDDGGDKPGAGSNFCKTCSFRPWARTGTVESVTVTVARDGVALRNVPAVKQADGSWLAATALQPGEVAFVNRGGVRDGYDEINSAPTQAIDAAGVLSDPPAIDPSVDVPEGPVAALLPLLALAMLGVGWAVRRRSVVA
ncbi:MAG: hypothetical protein QOJ79_2406 [Actinomycetota bacterium]|jgi:hypothetical protein|nr:hypothetical protein [Actinomycetota bacterium]